MYYKPMTMNMNMNMNSLLEVLQPLQPTLIAIALLLFLLRSATCHRRRRFPPGPTGWPIIGNMLMMDQLTHRGLHNLARKYGGLFHLRMGFRHMVAVSSPEYAREVLQLQDNIFSNRPATIAITYLTYDRVDMAFANYGPFWRQMRKICVMKLFSRKRAESWASVREEVDKTVRAAASSVGKAMNIGELVFALTRDIIYRAAFGTSACKGRDKFIGILQEFSKLFGAFNIADFLPYLTWVDLHGLNNRLVKARRELDEFIDSIIEDHMYKKSNNKNGSDGEENDMVDELLAFYSEDVKPNGKLTDLQNPIRFTRDHIKAIVMDVMFGGTETVASAIEWAMAELLNNPKDLERVQQELADVVGLERKVQEGDIEKLTYFKCVLKETLRLHPPIPLLLHETAEDTEIGGYFIPAKTRVMINAFSIARDPNSWDAPEIFKPSRFLNEGAPDFRGSNFEFIPFGSGRRSCPGMQLGLYALELCVANLLHCFTWELPDGMKPTEMDMSDVFGLTAPRATRLVAIPKLRLLGPVA